MNYTSKMSCLLIVFSAIFSAKAKADNAKDSVKHWNVKPRVYSGGFLGLAGLIFNRNITVDLTLTYGGKAGTAMLFKSQDVEDGRSGVNYMFTGYFKVFKLAKRFYVTPFAGYFAPQTSKLFGETGSSPVFSITGTHIFGRFTFDHTIIGASLINQPGKETMINRSELKYRSQTFSITGYTWYNVHKSSTENSEEYLSVGVEVNFQELHISEKIKLQSGLTAYRYLRGNESGLLKGGLIFHVSYPISF